MRGSPFFDGVSQIDAEIAGQAAMVPIFYYDTSAMTALFPARYSELRRLLPDPRFVPARLAPGVGVVGVGCLASAVRNATGRELTRIPIRPDDIVGL